jgi:O-acetylhomoserine (thiol)-lyase
LRHAAERERRNFGSESIAGVSDGYLRLSVGIEHIDDIITNLEQGLLAAGTLASAA